MHLRCRHCLLPHPEYDLCQQAIPLPSTYTAYPLKGSMLKLGAACLLQAQAAQLPDCTLS